MFSGVCRCLAQARGGTKSRFSQPRGYSTVGSAIRSQRIGCGGARPPCARNVCWQKHSDAATHKGVSPKWGEARSPTARCLWHRTSEAEVGGPFRGVGGISLSAARRQIAWGYSTVGSAIRSQRIGHEFESRYLHHVAARRLLTQRELAQAVFVYACASRAVETELLLFPRICAGDLKNKRHRVLFFIKSAS